jgi:hypothetical protein
LKAEDDDIRWEKQKSEIKKYLDNKEDACGIQFVSLHGQITVVNNFEDMRKYTHEVDTPVAEHLLAVTTGKAMMAVRATKSALQQIM